MQDDDLPVLRNALSSGQQTSNQPISVSSEVVASIIAKIQPQLVKEIEAAITPKLREKLNDTLISESVNIQKANQSYLSSAIHQLYEQKVVQIEEKLVEIQDTLNANLNIKFDASLDALAQKSNVALLDQLNQQIKTARQELTSTIDHTLNERIAQSINDVQQNIMSSTVNFVDKTKADLATQLPTMMHNNVDIIKSDLSKSIADMQAKGLAEMQDKLNAEMPTLEAGMTTRLEEKFADLENKTVDIISQTLKVKMEQLHSELLVEHQAKLNTQLNEAYDVLVAKFQSEIASHAINIQSEAESTLQQKLGETFPSLYEGLSNDLIANLEQDFIATAEKVDENFKAKLTEELPKIDVMVETKVNSVLESSVGKVEAQLAEIVRMNIRSAIDSVKLVISDQ